MKTVKFVKVPGGAVEVGAEDNATLKECLDIYAKETKQTVSGYDMRVGDSNVEVSFVPADNAKIFLVQKVKGNF